MSLSMQWVETTTFRLSSAQQQTEIEEQIMVEVPCHLIKEAQLKDELIIEHGA